MNLSGGRGYRGSEWGAFFWVAFLFCPFCNTKFCYCCIIYWAPFLSWNFFCSVHTQCFFSFQNWRTRRSTWSVPSRSVELQEIGFCPCSFCPIWTLTRFVETGLLLPIVWCANLKCEIMLHDWPCFLPFIGTIDSGVGCCSFLIILDLHLASSEGLWEF